MSYSGDVDLVFGDGEHRFRLRIGELRELQEKCKAGPPVILQRLASQTWQIEDVAETIRLGLIGGGGATPGEAHRLVQRHVHEGGWLENVLVAHAVLVAALIGPEEDDDLGEPAGEGATEPPPSPMPSRMGASASPPSIETAAPSASPSPTPSASASSSTAPTSPDGAPPTAPTKPPPRRRRPTKSTTP